MAWLAISSSVELFANIAAYVRTGHDSVAIHNCRKHKNDPVCTGRSRQNWQPTTAGLPRNNIKEHTWCRRRYSTQFVYSSNWARGCMMTRMSKDHITWNVPIDEYYSHSMPTPTIKKATIERNVNKPRNVVALPALMACEQITRDYTRSTCINTDTNTRVTRPWHCQTVDYSRHYIQLYSPHGQLVKETVKKTK